MVVYLVWLELPIASWLTKLCVVSITFVLLVLSESIIRLFFFT